MRAREVSDLRVVLSVKFAQHSTFARIATSADAGTANAKDMDADLRTPRGTVDDTAVLGDSTALIST